MTTEESLTDLHNRLSKKLGEGPIKMWGVNLSADKADIPTKTILQKFLRANKNSVDPAERQLLATIKWREEFFAPDGKVKGTWDEDKFKGLGWITKEQVKVGEGTGDVVVAWNIYGAVKDFDATFGDVEEFLRWRVALMECTIDLLDLGSAKSLIPDDGPDPYKAVQIHDYLQVSFIRSPPSVKAASKKAIELFQKYYPELLDKKYFVNVPVLMGWFFTVMKTLIARETLKKLEMLSYGSYLAKELGSESIPAVYGGKGAPLSDRGMSITSDGQLVRTDVAPGLKESEITPSGSAPGGRDSGTTKGGRIGSFGSVGDSVRMVDSAGPGGGGEAAEPTPVVTEAQKDTPPPVPVKEQ